MLCACEKPQQHVPETDASLLWRFAETNASVVPRNSGSVGAVQSTEWIRKEAEKLKKFNTSVMEFDALTPDGTIRFRNIVCDIKGKSGKRVIVGAHYDTKKFLSFEFQGANDGASGVASLLAMMNALEALPEPPPLSLRFVFFDGEECISSYGENDGLHGSRRAAAEWQKNGFLKNCIAMILLDMVGDRDLTITVPKNSDERLKLLAFEEAGRLGYGKFFNSSPHEILDDHVPFLEKGVPVIDFIDFSYGPANSYWHSSADTLDKISAESMKIVSDTALALIWRLANER